MKFKAFLIGALVGLTGCSQSPIQPSDTQVDITADAVTGDTNITADAVSDILDDVSEDTGLTPSWTCDPVTIYEAEEVAVVSGTSETLTFEVPENAVSILITAEGSTRNNLVISSLIGPTQQIVTPNWDQNPDNQGGLCLTCPNRVTPSEGVTATLVPNNPNAELQPGTHELTFKAFRLEGGFGGFGGQPVDADDSLTVKVFAKVMPEEPQAGILHLNLHFTGANGWTADSAPDDPAFQALIEDVDAIYASVGIQIGEITYQDVDPKFKVISEIQGEDSDLMAMFASSTAYDLPAVNVFFVEELVGPFGRGFGVLLGIAGGIPGPTLVPGTARSGVAISTTIPPEVSTTLSGTMAHEMGHFLGLFHTSEETLGGLFPAITDPLPDTPEDADESWLMHKQGAGSKLSPWQGRVMRSNPVICHSSDDTP